MLNYIEFEDALLRIENNDPTFSKFILIGFEINDNELSKLVESLKENTNLKFLNLAKNNIDDEKAHKIAKIFEHNSGLENISFDQNPIKFKGIKSIVDSLSANTNLTKLSFNNCAIGDEELFEIAKVQHLQELHLTKNEFGLSGLDAVIAHNKLKQLNLFDNQIGDEGAQTISRALATNSSLVKLSLSLCGITDIGAQSIAEALSTNLFLEKLSLSSNKIGDLGAESLARNLASKTSLKELSLTNNEIGARGLEALSSITHIKINYSKNLSKDLSAPTTHLENPNPPFQLSHSLQKQL